MFLLKRLLDACFAVFTALLWVSSLAAQTPGYTVTPIVSAADPSAPVYASYINRRGFVAAISNFPAAGQPPQGFVWKDGNTTALLPSLGGSCSYAWGINNVGHVAGTACLPGDTARHAILWRNGHLTDLGALGGGNSSGTRVNRTDQVAGVYVRSDGSIRGFFWNKGRSVDVGDLGGNQVFVIDFGDARVITGQSDVSTDPDPTFGVPPFHGFAWKNGAITDFGQLFGSNFNTGNGVDREGRIVGAADLAGDVVAHAFLWDRGSVQDLSNDVAEPVSWAIETNNRNQIIGLAGFVDPFPGDGPPVSTMLCPCRVVLWDRGQLSYLDTIVDPRWSLQIPIAINDRGEIIALAIDTTTFSFGPVLLKPVKKDDSASTAQSAPAARTNAQSLASTAVKGPARIHRSSDGQLHVEF